MKKLSPFLRYDLPGILKMIMPPILTVIIALYYSDFVWYAVNANMAINGAIISVALYAVFLIVLRLISMQQDMSALDRFSKEAAATGDMEKLIDLPWIKGRAIHHYLGHLAHTGGTLASKLDQDAIQNELDALGEEYTSKMELPNFLVGFMIALGLLGTFIGLLQTLTGISGMLDSMGHGGDIQAEFSKLISELRKPLSGMGIAFSTSMFGLITSLQLSFMMIMLRRYMSRVMEKARTVMHNLVHRIKSDIPLPAGIEGERHGGVDVDPQAFALLAKTGGMGGGAAGEAMLELSEKITDAYFKTQDSITNMANNISVLSKRMDAIVRSLETSIEVGNKTNSLLSFGPRLLDTNEALINIVRSLSDNYEDNQKLIQKIISSLIQIDQSLMSNSTREVVMAQRETLSILNEMFSGTQTHTRLLTEGLEVDRVSSRETVQAIKSLGERMNKQEELQKTSSEHLMEIKEYFAKAVNSFALIDMVAENIGRQTLLVEASVAEGRNLQKEMIGSLERELKDFTAAIKKTT